MMIKD